MMILKRNLLAIALFAITAIITGFKSGKDPLPGNVGLISVYVSSQMGLVLPSVNGAPAPDINDSIFYSRIREQGGLNHSSSLVELKQDLFKMPESLPFKFIDESTIISAPVYTGKIADRYKGVTDQAAAGYLPILYSDKFSRVDAFTIDPTMDGVMVAWVQYTMNVTKKVGDLGVLHMHALLTVQVFNKEGKKVAKWSSYGTSSDFNFKYKEMFTEAMLETYCVQALTKARAALPAELKK